MAPRGQRRPGDRFQRPRRKVTKQPKSGGACSMAIPAAAVRTVVALARLAYINSQIGRAQ